MESEVNPDNFLFICSKVIDKFSDILESIVFFYKYTHSSRANLPIWMKEFIDKVDDYECSFHIFWVYEKSGKIQNKILLLLNYL